jgi:hypothetical protein
VQADDIVESAEGVTGSGVYRSGIHGVGHRSPPLDYLARLPGVDVAGRRADDKLGSDNVVAAIARGAMVVDGHRSGQRRTGPAIARRQYVVDGIPRGTDAVVGAGHLRPDPSATRHAVIAVGATGQREERNDLGAGVLGTTEAPHYGNVELGSPGGERNGDQSHEDCQRSGESGIEHWRKSPALLAEI